MSDAAVEIEYLKKSYGRFQALAGVSLSVPRGSVFGLLGPNGAGKSTLVKSLLTIIRPTECRGTLLGKPIGDRKTLSRVGYLPEQAKFQDYLTGRQIITYSGRLTGMSSNLIKSRIVELLDIVKMKEWADKPVGTYSKGMRQRIGLAQALVNSPEIVFLDEPTDGVDPEGRIDIRGVIEQMKAEGRTVFINSHLLSEVEQLADQVAILTHGKVLRTGTVAELTRGHGHYTISTLEPIPMTLREKLKQSSIQVAGNKLTIESGDVAAIQPVIDALRAAGLTIREIREERFTLEEAFLQAIRSEGKEAA
jgi:ABC-2 type transport system ATP-binding protein